MTPIPEDRELMQAPPPTHHQPTPTMIDDDGDSVMETQPENEPSAAASSRASRSLDITPERNVRPRTETTDSPMLPTGFTPTPPTPPGGWQASGSSGPTSAQVTPERRNPYPFPAVPPSQYLVNGDVLAAYDDEHNNKLEAYTVGMHDGTNYTTPTIPPNHAYTVDHAVCVYDVETRVFWVTPAPKDKDGVVYENLSPRDRKIRCFAIQRNECDDSEGKQ